MKSYLLLGCLSVLLITSPCVAQEEPGIPPHVLDGAPLPPHLNDDGILPHVLDEVPPHSHMDEDDHRPKKDFAKELGLTEEQKKQAKLLHEEMHIQMKPIKEEMKKLREKAHELRQENRKAFEAILTEEQKEKLKQIIPPHKEGKFKRHHNKKRGFFPHTPK